MIVDHLHHVKNYYFLTGKDPWDFVSSIYRKPENYRLKIDGSLSIVVKKGEVACKTQAARGVFFYSHNEIDQQYGQNKRKADSLKHVLDASHDIDFNGNQELQGDLLFTPSEPGHVYGETTSFCANVLAYNAKTTKRIGVAFHSCDGKSLVNLPKSDQIFIPDLTPVIKNDLVINYTPFKTNIDFIENYPFKITADHISVMYRYVNYCVRTNGNATARHYSTFIEFDWIPIQLSKYKTEKSRIKYLDIYLNMMAEIRMHHQFFERHFDVVRMLEDISSKIVPSTSHKDMVCARPEGLVCLINNTPAAKIVDRTIQRLLLNRNTTNAVISPISTSAP